MPYIGVFYRSVYRFSLLRIWSRCLTSALSCSSAAFEGKSLRLASLYTISLVLLIWRISFWYSPCRRFAFSLRAFWERVLTREGSWFYFCRARISACILSMGLSAAQIELLRSSTNFWWLWAATWAVDSLRGSASKAPWAMALPSNLGDY